MYLVRPACWAALTWLTKPAWVIMPGTTCGYLAEAFLPCKLGEHCPGPLHFTLTLWPSVLQEQASTSTSSAYEIPTKRRGMPKEVIIYQYEVCPFCCKVKAFLDYHKVRAAIHNPVLASPPC